MHIDVTGRGEPLVMLHGWGMHGGVWQHLVGPLGRDFEIHAVDLPGHGRSARRAGQAGASSGPFTLDAVVDALSARFAEPVNVLGWSLGGIVAQRWAVRKPATIKRLILVASTPCFANRADWNCGMPSDILSQFAADLEHNFTATLRRFLALQARGSDTERELLAALRERLFSRGEPDLEALRDGLAILRDADLRAMLETIRQPVLLIAGERDRLTPPQASHYMAHAIPHAQLVEIKGAAHAPFLSHPGEFLSALRHFMEV